MNKDNDKLQKGFDEITDKEVPPSFVWDNIVGKLETEDSDALQTGFDNYYSEEEPPLSLWNNIQNTLTNNSFQDNNSLANSPADNIPYSWKQRLHKIAIVILLLIFVRTCLPETCGPEVARSAPNNLMYAINNTDPSFNPTSSQQNKTLGIAKKTTSSVSSKTNPLQNIEKKTFNSPQNPKNLGIPTSSKHHNTLIAPFDNAAISNVDNLNNTEHPNNQTTTALSLRDTKQNTSASQHHNTLTTSFDHAAISNADNLNNAEHPNHQTSSAAISTLAYQHINTSNILPLAETIPFEIEKTKKNPSSKFPKFELGLIGKLGTSLLLGNMTNEGFRQSSLQETEMQAAGSIGLLIGLKITARDAIVAQFTPYSSTSQSFGTFSTEGRHYQQVINLSYVDFSLGYERDLIVYDIVNDNNSSIFARLDIGLSYLVLEQLSVNEKIIQSQAFKKWSVSTGLTLGNRHQFNHFVLDYGFFGSIGMNDINNNTYLPNQTTNLLHLGGFVALKYKLN